MQNATYLGDKSRQKVAPKYYCEKCDYSTSKLSDWKNILRRKNTMLHKCYKMLHVNLKKSLKSCSKKKYFCQCGKSYKHHSSYYRHKQKCDWEEGRSR